MRRALLAGCTVLVLSGFTTAAMAHGPSSTSPSTDTAKITAAEQHQLVPAYFWPSGTNLTNPWHKMCRTMSPGSTAIVDPNVGPGTRRLAEFTEAISYCHTQRQRVIGYVSTDYGTRSLASTLLDVDRYYAWYRVDGIFLDEMSNKRQRTVAAGLSVAAYYKRVYDHVKARSGARGRYVVGNPGAPAASAWQLTLPVADNVVVFEDTAAVYLSRTPPPWVSHQPAGRISALIKNTSSSLRHRVCTLTRARNEGAVEVTNDGPPNTWDTLPTYWSEVSPRCQ